VPSPSDLLGFDGPTGNTYGSIATVDYMLESVSAAAVLLAGLGASSRICCCGARWSSVSAAGDGFVQSSSIMPQKRNPVALEHARAIGSKALGQASAIMLSVHNTPVRRHRRHRGRSAAARGVDVSRRRARGDAGRRGDA
jgi:argininosuccinate lyase